MNVVTILDKKTPVYELAGDEIVFPLLLDQDGIGVVAYFHMDAHPPAHEIKAFLNDMMGGYRASNVPGETETTAGDESQAYKFIDAHFRTISGIEGDATQEEIKAFLDDNPGLKSRILREGYDGFSLDIDEKAPTRLVLARSAETTVRLRRPLYCPETQQIEVVQTAHVMKKETEEDRIKHKRASKFVEKGRQAFYRFNFDVYEQLYDNLVLRLNGVQLNGTACTEQNKADWCKTVSIFEKIFVVNRIFSRIAVKNG